MVGFNQVLEFCEVNNPEREGTKEIKGTFKGAIIMMDHEICAV